MADVSVVNVNCPHVFAAEQQLKFQFWARLFSQHSRTVNNSQTNAASCQCDYAANATMLPLLHAI